MRLENHVHAGRDRELGLTAPQALTRKVHRDKRGGTRGVDGHARPAQAEQVRQAARRGVAAAAGGHVEIGAAGFREHPGLVVVDPHADEHAGRAGVEARDDEPRVLERFPRDLEQQPLLRVEALGLARRDPEEARVEAIDVLEKPTAVVESVHARSVTGSIGSERADRVAAALEQIPERVRPRGARKPAAEADDGDRLSLVGRMGVHGFN